MKVSGEKLQGNKHNCWKIVEEQMFFKKMLWAFKGTLVIPFIIR